MLELLVLAGIASAALIPDVIRTATDHDQVHDDLPDGDEPAQEDQIVNAPATPPEPVDPVASADADPAEGDGDVPEGDDEPFVIDVNAGQHVVEGFDPETDRIEIALPGTASDLQILSADVDGVQPPTLTWQQDDGRVDLRFDELEVVPIDRIDLRLDDLDYPISLIDAYDLQENGPLRPTDPTVPSVPEPVLDDGEHGGDGPGDGSDTKDDTDSGDADGNASLPPGSEEPDMPDQDAEDGSDDAAQPDEPGAEDVGTEAVLLPTDPENPSEPISEQGSDTDAAGPLTPVADIPSFDPELAGDGASSTGATSEDDPAGEPGPDSAFIGSGHAVVPSDGVARAEAASEGADGMGSAAPNAGTVSGIANGYVLSDANMSFDRDTSDSPGTMSNARTVYPGSVGADRSAVSEVTGRDGLDEKGESDGISDQSSAADADTWSEPGSSMDRYGEIAGAAAFASGSGQETEKDWGTADVDVVVIDGFVPGEDVIAIHADDLDALIIRFDPDGAGSEVFVANRLIAWVPGDVALGREDIVAAPVAL